MVPEVVELRKERFEKALAFAYIRLHRHSKHIYDSIYQMLAFAVAMEFDGYFGRYDESGKWITWQVLLSRQIDRWVEQRKAEQRVKKKKPVEIYQLIFDDLKGKFVKEGYGWCFDLPRDLPKDVDVVQGEEGRYKRGLQPRWHLYPVHKAKLDKEARDAANAESFARVSAVIEEEKKVQEQERQEFMNTPGGAILAKIADIIGEKRFDLWFGQDTVCKIENDTAVFEVRNTFAINSIRRHCKDAIEVAIAAVGNGAVRLIADGSHYSVDFRVRSAAAEESAESDRQKQIRIDAAKAEAKTMRERHEAAAAEWREKQLLAERSESVA